MRTSQHALVPGRSAYLRPEGARGERLAVRVGLGPASGRVQRRSGDGDVDRSDDGDGAGAAVGAGEVAGGGAFDLAGTLSGPAGGARWPAQAGR
jgi:hypothetical protein